MIEAIPLDVAIFSDPNFAFYLRHTFDLAKKLGLKAKGLKTEVLNKRIGQIWANKIIAELDLLFTNNPKW